jgi:cell division protein ZapA
MAMIEKSPKSEIDHETNQANQRIHGLTAHDQMAYEQTKSHEIRIHEVEIAGVPLRLKSSHDDQTVNELVALVDGKIREALPLTKTGSIQNASILASLHLAEEYLLLKRKAKMELDSLEAKALQVISELESSRVTTGTDKVPHGRPGQA